MKGKMKLLGELFAVFFRIGLFTFGGGYAMIPLIEREVVEGKKWISSDDVLDMLAIAESTPGPLAVNSATFVGYRMGGVIGSAVATIALAIPSVVIICIISLFITQFKESSSSSRQARTSRKASTAGRYTEEGLNQPSRMHCAIFSITRSSGRVVALLSKYAIIHVSPY